MRRTSIQMAFFAGIFVCCAIASAGLGLVAAGWFFVVLALVALVISVLVLFDRSESDNRS